MSDVATKTKSDQVLRFRQSERHLHWAVAVPFMVSWVSALVLVVVYNASPERPWRETVSLVHKISGICLIVLPLLTVLWHRRDFSAHLHNIRHAWRWSWHDVRWLFLMAPAALNSRIELPHQGKFNAAEKINFMILTSTYPLYVITGLLIWMPGIAILAWFFHFGMAIVATPLLFGHVFMATINRDTRVGLSGMVTGFVDRHWARHHYRLWYDELYGDEGRPHAPAPVAAPSTPPAARPATAPRPRVAAAVPPLRPASFPSPHRIPPNRRPEVEAG